MNSPTAGRPSLPAYFDRMIAAFHAGKASRHAHLGHWGLRDCSEPHSCVQLNAQLFSENGGGFVEAQRRMNSELIGLAGVRNGNRILDVACGFGGMIQQLNEQLADSELHGINIDDRQLEICQQLRPVNANAIRWQEADACDLPFASQTFDTLFCVEAMFHFASRKAFLAEAGRVLMPGGTLVVTDFSLTACSECPSFCLEAVLADGYGPWPDPWCREGTAVDLLRNSDWQNIRQIDATANTLPSYQYVVPSSADVHRDPGDAAIRSALLLQWLHQNAHLRYDYLAATAGATS